MKRLTDLKAAIRAVLLCTIVLALLVPAAVASIHAAEDTLGSSAYLLESTGDPITLHLSSVDASRFPDVYVYGWVRDSDGEPIEGLTRDHFVLTEQSELEEHPVEQTISVSTVEGVVDNVAIVLTIDRSGSMRGTPMSNAKVAAKTLVDTLKAEDRCAVVSFGSTVTLDHAFVGADEAGKTSLKEAIDRISAGGGTPLYSAIIQSLGHLDGEVGIPAVIALTDGQAGDSHLLNDMIALAQAKGVPVYTIGLGGVNEAALRRIADETGGSYYYTPDSEELRDIYLEIAAAIQGQYLLAYRTHNRDFDGTMRTIEVTASHHGQIDSDTITYRVAEPPQISLTEHTKELISVQQPGAKDLTISAEITSSIGVRAARLFYRTSGTGKSYTEISMSENDSIYSAEIPGDKVTDPGIEFYITASDGVVTSSSPKTKPAEFPHQIAVQPNEKPIILHEPVQTASPWTNVSIEAVVTDDAPYGPIDQVVLYYRPSDEVLYKPVLMGSLNGLREGIIPEWAVTPPGIDYYIMAVDIHGVRAYAGTADQPHHITVPWFQLKKVAYIPVEFADEPASLHVWQLEERARRVERYFSHQSYGRVRIRSEFILNDAGGHTLLERRYSEFTGYVANPDTIPSDLAAVRAIMDKRGVDEDQAITELRSFIEWLKGRDAEYAASGFLIATEVFAKLGIDYDMYPQQLGPLKFPDYASVVIVKSVRQSGVVGFAWDEWVQTSEQRGLGVWAHELGHALFDWKDYYETGWSWAWEHPVLGPKPAKGGYVGHWCVMGRGAHMNPPSMVMSFNKVSAGWLEYAYTSPRQEIPMLYQLVGGDPVYIHSPYAGDVQYYIFEGRHPDIEQGVEDPIHSLEARLFPERGIMIYKVMEDGMVYSIPAQSTKAWDWYAWWTPNPRTVVTLLPDDVYVYEDYMTETRFTAREENSTLYLYTEPFRIEGYFYVCFGEVSIDDSAIVSSVPTGYRDSRHDFDISLQVYTDDGRMVGPDHEAFEHRMEIDGAQASGPILGGGPEWIAVPSHEKVYFVIDPTPARKWAEELGLNSLTVNVEVKAGFYDSEGERTEAPPVTVTIGLDEPLHFIVEDGEIRLLADVVIDPDTVNLRAQGHWITAYIELPGGYAVEDIDIDTVQLVYDGNELDADLGDVQDGVLMVKFDWATVALWFEGLHDVEVELSVAGEVDGVDFQGTDTIRVIDHSQRRRGR